MAWRVGGLLSVITVAHEDRLDLRPEGREVLAAHLRPALEDLLAIRASRPWA